MKTCKNALNDIYNAKIPFKLSSGFKPLMVLFQQSHLIASLQ